MKRKQRFLYLAFLAAAWGWALASKADVTSQANWTIATGGNGHTYRVVAKPSIISWNSANAEAQAAGGYLATITSAAENNFIFNLINNSTFWTQTQNGHGPWIGGYQQPGSTEPAGGFTWVLQTGASVPEPFAYTNWETGEPNNLTTTISGVTYNQDRVAFFHLGTGRAATWSDEYNLTGSGLNQWTISYVIEFNPVPPALTAPTIQPNGALQFTFTNIPGASFNFLVSTNATLSATNWTVLGAATESSPGQYQFMDSSNTNASQRFYRVELR